MTFFSCLQILILLLDDIERCEKHDSSSNDGNGFRFGYLVELLSTGGTYGKMERKKLKQKIGNPIILNLTSVEN